MTRHWCRAIAKVVILFLWLGQPSAAAAQMPGEPNRVGAVVEDAAGSLVVLHTIKPTPVPAPVIQYLRGAANETVLVADFPGLLFSQAPRSIIPPSGAIRRIQIGQFQSNPPLLRIAVSTHEPNALRDLAFRSSPGVLILRWGTARPNATSSTGAGQGTTAGTTSRLTQTADSLPQASSIQEAQLVPRSKAAPPVSQPLSVQPGSAGQAPLPGRAGAMPAPAPPRQTLADAPKPVSDVKINEGTAQANRGKDRHEQKHESKWKSALRRIFGGKPSATVGDGSSAPAISAPDLKDEPPPARPPAARGAIDPRSAKPGPPGMSGIAKSSNTAARRQAEAQADRRMQAGQRDALKATPAPVLTPARGAAVEERKGGDQREKSDSLPGGAGLPRLEATGSGPVKVEIASGAPLSYRTFRLHDPERYVIDFQSFPNLTSLPAPALEPNPLILSIRVGTPENDPSLTRVVLDLSAAGLEVREALDESKHLLALTVDKGFSPPDLSNLPAGMTIVLDAGHGGSDPGAQRGDIQEKSLTLAISEKVKKLFEGCGLKVVMTRAEDISVPLEDRVNLTNTVQPHAFLSIHINSLESDSSIHGIETYYQNEQSRYLARSIHDSLVSRLEVPDRKVRKARFYVINHTPHPAVLAEVGFISNKEERAKLISSDYQDRIAGALTEGVILYLSRRGDLIGSGAGQGQGGPTRESNQPEGSGGRKAASLAGLSSAKTAK